MILYDQFTYQGIASLVSASPCQQFINDSVVTCLQGRRESLRGPGQNICDDCFNRVFDCSIRVYRSFGAHKQSGAQGKMPQLPPPLGGPACLSELFVLMQYCL